MNNSQAGRPLDEQLRDVLGAAPQPDFAAWREKHGEALHYLNPVVSELYLKRRKWIMRISSAAVVAAAALAVVALMLTPQKETFAQAVSAINEAETISWVVKTYTRCTSEDQKRTWLEVQSNRFTYRAPNLYRHERRDQAGKLLNVTITDTRNEKTLHLNMQTKQATWLAKPPNQYGSGNPLGWMTTVLDKKPIELMGQREWRGETVNVFRFHREKTPDKRSVEVWLNTRTKQVVGFNDPGIDVFDPATAEDRNNPPEPRRSKMQPVGSIGSDIKLNTPLDPKQFRLAPPAGFTVKQGRPLATVDESKLIEWLRVTARFNDGVFVDTVKGIDHEPHTVAAKKAKADRSAAEQEFLDLWREHISLGHSYPIWDFAEAHTIPKSFRYIGKGVKLGDSERLVCWYKLKSTGKLRAVYGDLTVKNVAPDDLPLPIE